jgi:hypothetical protein
MIKKWMKSICYYCFRIIKGGKFAFGYKHIGYNSVICHPLRVIGKKYISFGDGCFVLNGLRIEAVGSWGASHMNLISI